MLSFEMPLLNDISAEAIEQLVLEAQRGNEKSFSELFDYFFPRVSRHIAFRVPEENQEDLTSDVFLKVVQGLKKYESKKTGNFSAWIFRIAHNTIIDFYRKKKELLGIDDEEDNFFIEIPDEKTPSPEEAADRSFDIDKMYAILRTLPVLQRTILELKFLEGFSNAEIAHITGKSEGNVRLLQLRALRQMRKDWDNGN